MFILILTAIVNSYNNKYGTTLVQPTEEQEIESTRGCSLFVIVLLFAVVCRELFLQFVDEILR